MKNLLLVFFVITFCRQYSYAQILLTGKVYRLNTTTVLPSVKVQNVNTRDNTLTNAAGIFSIKAKPGDILIMEGFFYQPDTIAVSNIRYIEIYLVPKNDTLKEVTILNTSTRLGNLTDPGLHNQAIVYLNNDNNIPTGGIAIRFGYGKGGKEKKDEQRTYNELASEEIDNAFSTASISKYVPLNGIALNQFIALYRPTIKQYKAPGFKLAFYLNDCYKKFKVLTPGQRKLPRLQADTTIHQ